MTDWVKVLQLFHGHRPATRWIILSAMGVLITGCASRSHVTYDGRTGSLDALTVSAEPTDPHFVYVAETIEAENHVVDRNRHYEIRQLSFPSIGDNGQVGNLVTVDYHRSLTPGNYPVVIVLPIWGRHIYPSDAITRTLRKRSNGRVHILSVLGPEFLIDWPRLGVETDEQVFFDTWVEGAEREITTVIDLMRLIDWAQSRPEINGNRIGLIGFSHGAMLAPALATQEPRISATVLVMGGADPHEVIARCVGARTEGVQLHAQETFGWSQEEMAAILAPVYGPVNAANYPGRVDPETVLIFDAGKDECVPESARDSLWEAMGRPERYTINSNHRHAFYTMTPLNFNWMRKKIWNFFEDRLLTSTEE